MAATVEVETCFLFIQLAACKISCFCRSSCQKFHVTDFTWFATYKIFYFFHSRGRKVLLVFYSAGFYVKYFSFYQSTRTHGHSQSTIVVSRFNIFVIKYLLKYFPPQVPQTEKILYFFIEPYTRRRALEKSWVNVKLVKMVKKCIIIYEIKCLFIYGQYSIRNINTFNYRF